MDIQRVTRLLGLCALLWGGAAARAAETVVIDPNLAPAIGSGAPTPISAPTLLSGVQPYRVAAPAGYHWALTFDDEFNGNNPKDGLWNGDYATLLWCNHGTCPQDFGQLSMGGGDLIIQPIQNPSNPYHGRRGDENSNGIFSQRYGLWEWRSKLPHDDHGEGDGLWPANYLDPPGKTGFPSGCNNSVAEIDVLESVMSTTDHHYTNSTVHDFCPNAYQIQMPKTDAGDLTQAFHQYQLWWQNDGTANGTVCFYFDGTQQGCHTLSPSETLWRDGLFIINQMEPCPVNNVPWGGGAPCTAHTSNSDPFLVDYTRVWQLVANGATPTPTPTARLPRRRSARRPHSQPRQ